MLNLFFWLKRDKKLLIVLNNLEKDSKMIPLFLFRSRKDFSLF